MKLSAKTAAISAVLAFGLLLAGCDQPRKETVSVLSAAPDSRDNASPWGMGTGAEWAHEYPRFHPLIAGAGARWVRTFPEWQSIQPAPDVWKWEKTDAIMEDLRKNNLRMIGTWMYFARFASADGGSRKGPIKDMGYWTAYVSESVKRYKDDIKYWEVWNEFNGSFYEGENKPKAYADLVVAAYKAAKAVDPTAKIGLSTASTDIGFLDLAIREGAAGHFDYIIVHPYENLDAMDYGDEAGFLGLADNLREMLRQNGQDPNMPIWITEIGAQAPVKADEKQDAHQAELLVKSYLLPLAQGFDRVYWFEIRGPAYGADTDFGVIREDWSIRPAFNAFKTMTSVLGQAPNYLGWVQLGEGGHGFVFGGAEGQVLAAWALPGKKGEARFDSEVEVVSLLGEKSLLPAGQAMALDSRPVYFRKLPSALVQAAGANKSRRFPWGGDYSEAKEIACRLGAENEDAGLARILLRKDHENRSVEAKLDGEPCRKVVGKDKDNNAIYFRADNGYIPFGTTPLEVSVVARRAKSGGEPKLSLTYESKKGYEGFKKGGEVWNVPAGDEWQEHTWTLDDACFGNRWGWNLGLVSLGAPEFYVKEVRVRKKEEGGGKPLNP